MAEYPGLDNHIVHPKGANIKKECDYCNKKKPLIKTDLGYIIFLDKDKLCFDIGDNVIWMSDRLRFCPVCGRKL